MISHSPTHLTLAEGTVEDCAAALTTSFYKLASAAKNAAELLQAAGFAGTNGDTAHDLQLAVALHNHLVQQFNVKVKTAGGTQVFSKQAPSASSAFQAAADEQGDTPCGITVTPDLAALAAAHRACGIAGTLDNALKNPTLSVALHSYARKRSRRAHAPATDLKRLSANDHD